MRLGLKNVRCFHSVEPVYIAPLTILVGENSTEKSSSLALQRIALELITGDWGPNFNKEPFFLGAYDQIAHFRAGRFGRASSFEISVTTTFFDPHRPSRARAALFTAQFIKHGSQPSLATFSFASEDYGFETRIVNKTIARLNSPNLSGNMGNIRRDIYKVLSSFCGLFGESLLS